MSFMNARKSTFNSQQFCRATLKFSRHTSCSEEKNTAVLYEAICVISLELDFKKKKGGGGGFNMYFSIINYNHQVAVPS